jgi:hypothetical protein
LQVDLETPPAWSYSILFSAPGLTPVESDRTIAVQPGAIVTQLRVLVQPDGFAPGRRIARQPTVGLVDPGGNVVASAPAAAVGVRLTRAGERPHEGARLTGTADVVALGGYSFFTDLALERFPYWDDSRNASTGLTLTFSAVIFGFGTVESRIFDLPGRPASPPLRR